MHIVAGDQKSFAVEMEITSDKWRNKTALWLNGARIGDWDDENLLAPFLNSFENLAENYETLWDNDLVGLDCRQIFLTIVPDYFAPDAFYDLSPKDQESLTRFDKYLFQWGENFDSWILRIVYRDGICKFLWAHPTAPNDIHCHDVKLEDVLKVYNDISAYNTYHK
jgi:hypothetical protein